MLEKFRQIKLREIEGLARLADNGEFPPIWQGKRRHFKKALRPENGLPAVIAEYKRASPSKGRICDSISACQASREYLENGASALSILTEKEFFQGDLGYLSEAHGASPDCAPPLLRKDFLFHPLQIAETAASPASALLLIVRMAPDARALRALREEAEKYGIACVVEIFNASELALARDGGADIIQVNARDLNTLRVDWQSCLRLINDNPPLRRETWIAASGIETGAQLRQAARAGYDAALIGSFLMAGGKPGKTLRKLLRSAKDAV